MSKLSEQLRDYIDGAAPPISLDEITRGRRMSRYFDDTTQPDPDCTTASEPLMEVTDPGAAASEPASEAETATGFRAPWRRPRVLLATMAAAALLVAALIVVGSGSHRRMTKPSALPSTAASQLRLIADRVTNQTVPHLTHGQFLLTQADLSVAANVNNGAAKATIGLSLQKWSTTGGQVCAALTAQPAQFASPSAQAAWSALGLRTLPNPPTAYPCTDASSPYQANAITGANEAIDVSSLPTDPTTLARELEAGTTGISTLDRLMPLPTGPLPPIYPPPSTASSARHVPSVAFLRAALILVGPLVGATPQFNSAVYRAIALIPGVVALGATSTHNGKSGQGFASGPGSGQVTIVVDPSSGQLLEVRDFSFGGSFALQGLALNYLPSVTSQPPGEWSADIQWLDPKGSPTVVSQSELPSALPTTVYAVGKPGVTDAQILPFDTNEGGMDGFMYLSPQSAPLPHSWGWSFDVPPSDPNVTSFVQALKASGLVQVETVVVF